MPTAASHCRSFRTIVNECEFVECTVKPACTIDVKLPYTSDTTSWCHLCAGSTPKHMYLMRKQHIKHGRAFGRATLKSLRTGEGNTGMAQLLHTLR